MIRKIVQKAAVCNGKMIYPGVFSILRQKLWLSDKTNYRATPRKLPEI